MRHKDKETYLGTVTVAESRSAKSVENCEALKLNLSRGLRLTVPIHSVCQLFVSLVTFIHIQQALTLCLQHRSESRGLRSVSTPPQDSWPGESKLQAAHTAAVQPAAPGANSTWRSRHVHSGKASHRSEPTVGSTPPQATLLGRRATGVCTRKASHEHEDGGATTTGERRTG